MLPETVCDGSVLLHVYRQIQEVLVFAANLQTDGGFLKLICLCEFVLAEINSCGLAIQEHLTHCFAVEAARLVRQGALEDLVDPRLLRLLSAFFPSVTSSVLHQLSIVLQLLALLLLEQVCNGVEEVVEKFMGVLLHVVVKEL